MPKSLRQTVIASAALVVIGTFAAAAAQPGTGNPTAVRSPPSATGARDLGAIEKQIDDLRVRLQISPAQQPQWERFAEVMRGNARDMDETFKTRGGAMPAMNAPENLRSYAGISARHAHDMENLVPAFEALYTAMSDGQKRVADQVFRDNAGRSRRGKG